MGFALIVTLAAALIATDTPAPREKVAVMDFTAAHIDGPAGTTLPRALADVATAEVARLGLDVISRADVEAMIGYDRLRVSLSCDEDASCLAEIGGALGSDLLLTGTISRLGDTYALSMTLVETKTASVRRRYQGKAGSEAVLPDLVRRGVGVLFERIVDASGTGTLLVKTNPPGASIALDGKEVGVSPLTLDDVAAGTHLVTATKGSLGGKTSIDVTPRAIARIDIELTPGAPVALKVLSTPPDARVALDGVQIGTTPLILEEVAAGPHVLTFTLEHHDVTTLDVDLSSDVYERGGREPLKAETSLAPSAVALELTGVPHDARVFVDDELVSTTSMQRPGSRALRIEHGGYAPLERTVELALGEPVRIDVEMTMLPEYESYLLWRPVAAFTTWGGMAGVALLAATSAALVVASLVVHGAAQSAYAEYLTATSASSATAKYDDVTSGVQLAVGLQWGALAAVSAALVVVVVPVAGVLFWPSDPSEEQP